MEISLTLAKKNINNKLDQNIFFITRPSYFFFHAHLYTCSRLWWTLRLRQPYAYDNLRSRSPKKNKHPLFWRTSTSRSFPLILTQPIQKLLNTFPQDVQTPTSTKFRPPHYEISSSTLRNHQPQRTFLPHSSTRKESASIFLPTLKKHHLPLNP